MTANPSGLFVSIDSERCTGCGECVGVCPVPALALKAGKAVTSGDHCLQCGHCASVCPAEAISVPEIDPDATAFSTMQASDLWVPYGQSDAAALARLMRSRRSCRRFLEKPVGSAILRDLARIGTTAPSATNNQPLTFTFLTERAAVVAFGGHVAAFLRRLNTTAANGFVRALLRWLGKPELDHYYRRHFASVRRRLKQWDDQGIDGLFHGAPAVLVIATTPGSSRPADDALLAAQNILLMAHAMGLATCLVGIAVAAIEKDPGIQQFLGIPREETVRAVIAIGYSDRAFLRCAGRKRLTLRGLVNDGPGAGPAS